jgi:RecA-family ATPase
MIGDSLSKPPPLDPRHRSYRSGRGRKPNGAASGEAQASPPARLELWNMGEDHAVPAPRRWVMKGTFCKGFLSGVAAGGGIGKTALRVVQLLAVATGRPLTGEHVHGRYRVLLISFEDDRDEARRRVWAATKHYGIPHDELLDCFWITNPIELKLAEISPDGGRRVIPGELEKELRRVIGELRIDVVAIDPFIKAHRSNENDNAEIDQVCTLLVRIAIDCGCAVDLLHHTSKGLVEPGDSERARGASALRTRSGCSTP